ncbi:hypothetical protein K505DRAFT_85135 [Melanomma pulvis-pyrius CBS 109.77]|uniref:Uncharacterized protein n=1 Tax=Melanomma pulvis-pyrius CBS 109.77 TaxID=1314802 RepID=A0A6A6XSF9_9PLEO|nr:hypothetical protein K505DRAFT_85135 [Melanomma pulvis-pyrius CBS 109.77]
MLFTPSLYLEMVVLSQSSGAQDFGSPPPLGLGDWPGAVQHRTAGRTGPMLFLVGGRRASASGGCAWISNLLMLPSESRIPRSNWHAQFCKLPLMTEHCRVSHDVFAAYRNNTGKSYRFGM